MQILTFNYTKSDGETSRRTLLTFVKPTNLYGGIDMSELEIEDQVYYVTEVEKAKAEYEAKLAILANDYDLKHRYRQFKPDNMTNINIENF